MVHSQLCLGLLHKVHATKRTPTTGELGSTPLMTVLYIFFALVMFSVGFYYIKEGLWLIGIGRVRNKES
jgi:hypothetical protein